MLQTTKGTMLCHRPSPEEMDEVFNLCRSDDWDEVLRRLSENPAVGVRMMVMANRIETTVVHQAITSRGDVPKRAAVISRVVSTTPQAAGIKNGYGSLPLHVIAQRNTKLDSKTKGRLIYELVAANKAALVTPGGVGLRTPLHVVFTGE